MPELPEVETVKRTLLPYCEGKRVKKVIRRRADLRWPIPEHLPALLEAKAILTLHRRAKYLLFEFEHGQLIIHLGMSGVLKIVDPKTEVGKHDHFDLLLEDNICLRLNDTRRFGAVLWQAKPTIHPLLANLGPEPLSETFNANYLYQMTRTRSSPIKLVVMDNHVVVGVGNIYANEALFRAKIQPETKANALTKQNCQDLVIAIKQVIARAIEQGGTTLKDYRDGRGKPGYFQQELFVYGRGGRPCLLCELPLTEIRLGQRTTVYCSSCQT